MASSMLGGEDNLPCVCVCVCVCACMYICMYASREVKINLPAMCSTRQQ